jgi:HEAT repeat protein
MLCYIYSPGKLVDLVRSDDFRDIDFPNRAVLIHPRWFFRLATMQKAISLSTFAVIACMFLFAGCGSPAANHPPISPTLIQTGNPNLPGAALTAAPSPTARPSPTSPPSPTPTLVPLPSWEELIQRFRTDVQPVVDTLLTAGEDPTISIDPADEIIYVPQTERLYAVQSVLGYTRMANPGAGRRVYVLYEILRGVDLEWDNQDDTSQTGLPRTQAVITTLRLIVESGGETSLIERVDGSGGEGSQSFEELITKSVLPLEKLPAALQRSVEIDLKTIAAYACGMDLYPDLDFTRRVTALSLTLESSEWADKEQGLAALANLPSLPDSLIPILLAHVSDERYSFEVSGLLSKMGADPDTFAQAIQDAGSPDAEVRREAARLLGEIPGDQAVAIPVLVELVRDEDDNVRIIAVDSLVTLGEGAVEPLIGVLQDPDMSVRERAAYGLGQLKDPRAIQPLVTAMHAGDSDLCWSAAAALGTIGGEAVEALIDLLRDRDASVRANTAWALGIPNDPRALEPLINALKDSDPNVRHNSAESLGGLGDPRAVLPITALLQDESQWVRERAIEVLKIFKDARAVLPLISAFKDQEWRVRSYASEALVVIGAPSVESLISALGNQNAEVRFWSAQTLEKIDDARAVEPLLEQLGLGNVEVVAGAYRFFIEAGLTGSETVLMKALDIRGTEEMAEAFLNCGNELLDQAARKWAEANNRTIRVSSVGDDYPIWGSRK